MAKLTNADQVRAIVREIKSKLPENPSEKEVSDAKAKAVAQAVSQVKMKELMAKRYVANHWAEKPKGERVAFSLTPKAFDKSTAPVRHIVANGKPVVNEDDDAPVNRIVDVGSSDEFDYSNDVRDSGLFDSVRSFSGYDNFGSDWNSDY